MKEQEFRKLHKHNFSEALKIPYSKRFFGVAAKFVWHHEFPRDFAWAPGSAGAPFFRKMYKIFRVQHGLP